MKPTIKTVLWMAGGFLASISPLVTVLILRWDDYVKTVPEGIRLGIGGVILLVMLIMKMKGTLKIQSGTTVALLVLVLSILLDRVLQDVTMLCAAYLAGDIVNVLFFKKKIDEIHEAAKNQKQAQASAEETRKVLQEYIGNGRT